MSYKDSEDFTVFLEAMENLVFDLLLQTIYKFIKLEMELFDTAVVGFFLVNVCLAIIQLIAMVKLWSISTFFILEIHKNKII